MIQQIRFDLVLLAEVFKNYLIHSGDVVMKIKFIAALLFSLGLLAGCGGGSSSTPGPTPLATITIDSTNTSKVAGGAFNAASQNFNSLSPLGVQTTTSTTSTNDRVLYDVTDFAMQKFTEHQNAPVSVTGAVTASSQCISGDANSGTIAFTSDGTGPSNSTYVTYTFTNCKLIAGSTTTINGTFHVPSFTISTNTKSVTVNINLTITTTGYPTIKYVGGYTLSATGVLTASRNDTLTGSSLVFSVDALNEALTNFSFSSSYDDLSSSGTYRNAYTNTVNYTISSDFTGGSFTFATITPIVRNSGQLYPRSGQVVIYGANASALRATIVSTDVNAGTASGTVTLELSTNTTTTSMGTWGTPVTRTWTQIRAGT
jgi:hypothetical protein